MASLGFLLWLSGALPPRSVSRRLLFISSGATPPVIRADTNPSKVVPAVIGQGSERQQLIYDRSATALRRERVVVREEHRLK